MPAPANQLSLSARAAKDPVLRFFLRLCGVGLILASLALWAVPMYAPQVDIMVAKLVATCLLCGAGLLMIVAAIPRKPQDTRAPRHAWGAGRTVFASTRDLAGVR